MKQQHLLLRFNDGITDTTPEVVNEVKTLQQLLKTEGSLAPNELVDGQFGQKTLVAVKLFQQKRSLEQDGIVGQQTWAALRNVSPSEIEIIPRRPNNENEDRWSKALAKAPTTGASSETAKQDGLPGGIASSEKMAQTDLSRVKAILERFKQIGAELDVPFPLLCAIASRESRCGNALDSQGFGDGGRAFGIMQVDERFHDQMGTEDPRSIAHIKQATRILVDYRNQVKAKFPNWEDEWVLRGAAAAYNSGVSNVQSKERLDVGTTGGDYSSDVIARAQYYATQL